MSERDRMMTCMERAQECSVQFGAYRVVPRKTAEVLLSEDAFERMTEDAVEGLGPRCCDGFYYWNVAAALFRSGYGRMGMGS